MSLTACALCVVSGKSRCLISTPLNLVLTDSKVGTEGKKGANRVNKIPHVAQNIYHVY